MKQLRNLLRPKFLLSGLLVATALAAGIGFANQPAHAAVDCDNNAVIRCGFTNLADFKKKYASNPYGDLKQLYGHWKVDGNAVAAQAKHVTVYKNGQVKTDDGTIVGTDAQSLGRQKNNGNKKALHISGKTYYYGSTQDNFASGSLDGYAMFNSDDHSMMLAILKACGNPVWAKSPGYKCESLKQTKVNDTTYKYVATPYTKNGAAVSKIVYDFGDGQTKTVTSNFSQEVSHTYKPGKYTARATVYFKVNGKEKSDTRQSCTKPVEVKQPPKPVYVCKSLVAQRIAGSRTEFVFTATAEVKDAKLVSGTFKFDDGTTQTKNAVGNIVTTTHKYEKEGNHTTTADLTFNVGKDNGNVKCKVVTKTVPPTCKDTPNKPECLPPCEANPNAPECKPPKTCADTPNAPECQPPKEDCTTHPERAECKETPVIPSTGPAEVIGSVVGLGSLTGAGVYYRASRRNLLSSILKS